jgi:glycosyltransferase involved in cell wall biosynthesis
MSDSVVPEAETREQAPESGRAIRTSIVVPVYNEEANVGPLVDEILDVLADNPSLAPAEVIFVDDGSTDGTVDELRAAVEKSEEIRVLVLSRNFGQSAALAAGIDHATGEFVVTMDGDRQNDPADIPRLVEELQQGYDCVSGWRKERRDPLSKRIPSAIQTKLATWTGPNIHDFGCTLKAYRAEALDAVNLYGEGHRYIPAKLYNHGYSITEIPVNHRERTAGSTKYGAARLLKGFVDLTFQVFWNRYSTRPIHFLGGLGLLAVFIGTVIGTHALYLKYVLGDSLLQHLPRLVFVVALILFGLLLVMFGFLAEMIAKIHYREQSPYRIDSTLGER